MALATVTTGDIMDSVAALLNDSAKTLFTYTAQLPYLNIAIAELREALETHNIAVTNEVIDGIKVAAGDVRLQDSQIPSNLVEIQKISERTWQSSESFTEMRRTIFLPSYVVQMQFLVYWSWQDQIVKFIGATTDRELRIEYTAARIPKATHTDGSDVIQVINAQSFLQYRTASLCSQFIGENPTRAQALDSDAQMAYDRFMIANIKGGQSTPVRRRPFMASWKSRSIW